MSSLNFSTDEKHKESIAMLEDALAYLKRMPHVPVTVDFCRKIQEHLDAPTNRLLMSTHETWRGEVFTAAGVKLLDATLCGDRLSVILPKKANGGRFRKRKKSYAKRALMPPRRGIGRTHGKRCLKVCNAASLSVFSDEQHGFFGVDFVMRNVQLEVLRIHQRL